jgi:hypothetical protein
MPLIHRNDFIRPMGLLALGMEYNRVRDESKKKKGTWSGWIKAGKKYDLIRSANSRKRNPIFTKGDGWTLPQWSAFIQEAESIAANSPTGLLVKQAVPRILWPEELSNYPALAMRGIYFRPHKLQVLVDVNQVDFIGDDDSRILKVDNVSEGYQVIHLKADDWVTAGPLYGQLSGYAQKVRVTVQKGTTKSSVLITLPSSCIRHDKSRESLDWIKKIYDSVLQEFTNYFGVDAKLENKRWETMEGAFIIDIPPLRQYIQSKIKTDTGRDIDIWSDNSKGFAELEVGGVENTKEFVSLMDALLQVPELVKLMRRDLIKQNNYTLTIEEKKVEISQLHTRWSWPFVNGTFDVRVLNLDSREIKKRISHFEDWSVNYIDLLRTGILEYNCDLANCWCKQVFTQGSNWVKAKEGEKPPFGGTTRTMYRR